MVLLESTCGDGGISSPEQICRFHKTYEKETIACVGVSLYQIVFAECKWVHMRYGADADGAQGVGNV